MALTRPADLLLADALANPLPLQGGGDFLGFAVLFLVLAVVAGLLGARGVAGLSMTIAKWLIIVFVVLAIVSFLL